MDFSEVIAARRSIRKFRPGEISEDTVKKLVDAARLAPSGSNLQPARFIIAKSPEAKADVARCTPYKFVRQAGVIFVCCADLTVITAREVRVSELFKEGAFDGVEMDMSDPAAVAPAMDENMIQAYLSLNTAIAIEHVVLKAVDLQLGSCWIGRFDREKLRTLLGLENHFYPVALLPVGYPAQVPPPRPRFDIDKYILKII